ncbi:MAG: class I SAM-dependent methyltransferase [Anaerolineales bacterium]|nr:class I SAM-dependent methyltransferase [Anaerolineales bacterium]
MTAIDTAMGVMDWETIWAPYDEATYQAVLEQIEPQDIVLDIGAGDLRLSHRIAAICRRVYAIEIQGPLIEQGQIWSEPFLENLIVLHGDARHLAFPNDATVGVLLMRHCAHFRTYADKLKALGASRLITNARWGMGVECLSLQSERTPYRIIEVGWYACWCGSIGFKPAPADRLTDEVLVHTHEVVNCPHCSVQTC